MNFSFNLPNWRRKADPVPVSILLGLSDSVERRQMRQAVARVLPTEIVEVDSKVGLHRAVTFQEFDLIIVDADLNGAASFDIVEQIRYGRLHCHAFPVVVMLCPSPGESCALSVIDCGADLVLTSESAARAIAEPLQRLMQERKPFVVAPHYIGPERRSADRQGATAASHIAVPNPVAARSRGLDDRDFRRQVSMATHAISLMRRGLYAVRRVAPQLPLDQLLQSGKL